MKQTLLLHFNSKLKELKSDLRLHLSRKFTENNKSRLLETSNYLTKEIKTLSSNIRDLTLIDSSFFKDPHTVKELRPLHDKYLIGDYSWIASGSFKEIYKSSLSVSQYLGVSLSSAAKIIFATDIIMSTRVAIDSRTAMLRNLDENHKFRAGLTKSLDESIKLRANTKEFILLESGREKFISSEEYALLYLEQLELKYRGYSSEFDSYLDWLARSSSYGIISSMCEFSDPGEFGRTRWFFETGRISPKTLNQAIQL